MLMCLHIYHFNIPIANVYSINNDGVRRFILIVQRSVSEHSSTCNQGNIIIQLVLVILTFCIVWLIYR